MASDGHGAWIVVWSSDEDLGAPIFNEHNLNVAVSRSTDCGTTWTIPTALNQDAYTSPGRDGRPEIATDGQGNWVCAWIFIDDLGGVLGYDFDILVARSSDNALTWSYPAPLNPNAAADSGDDWLPQIATDRAGHWVCVWATDNGLTTGTANFRVVAARSNDNGATWSDPVRVNPDDPALPGDDIVWDTFTLWGPRIASDGAGSWMIVWSSTDNLDGTERQDADILWSRSNDNGTSWTYPRVLNSSAATDGLLGDSSPKLAAVAPGDWLVIWESQYFTGAPLYDFDVAIARSSDNGEHWSPMATLNPNFLGDTGWNFSPTLASDGQGRWIAAWPSSAPALGGTGGRYGFSELAWAASDYLGPPAIGADVINYLLGRTFNPAGLDANGDGAIDIADAIRLKRLGR